MKTGVMRCKTTKLWDEHAQTNAGQCERTVGDAKPLESMQNAVPRPSKAANLHLPCAAEILNRS